MASLLERLTDPHQFDLLPSGPGAILDIGCGSAKTPGAVGMDISADTDADIVHDLDVFPYPIEDGSFDQILLQDVIEHVREPIHVFEELHRIARPGARIQLRTPHFSSVLAYGDPTHRHYFSRLAIESLAEPRFAHYTDVRFRPVHISLDLWLPFRLIGLQRLANRIPSLYEKYLAFRFPTMNIRAEFEVLK
ncbi:MAG TPA: methyltransferase domain-containing protein [Solirubrobacteraceae bacterium]|jgi:SAM-dependent methyltransferase|nr:methyltransferase domain-containing protein [Solirubrobacteraceae bacterium]